MLHFAVPLVGIVVALTPMVALAGGTLKSW